MYPTPADLYSSEHTQTSLLPTNDLVHFTVKLPQDIIHGRLALGDS